MSLRVAQACQQVVNGEAEPHLPGRIGAVTIDGVAEALRRDEVGEKPPQEQAFTLRLANETEFPVARAAVGGLVDLLDAPAAKSACSTRRREGPVA
jgi:hypothetical protein